MTTRRQTRLRPEICVGTLASGISASMKSGYVSPHSQVCMPPIDVPMTSRRWFTPRPSVSSRCSAVDHVAIAVVGKSRLQAVARLARPAVADVVGQDDEVAR